jgi:hypothetical protein
VIAVLPARSRRAPEALDELVGWILATPREEAVRRAARELHAGLDPALLLGATLVGAARAIHPDLPRFNHAALVVASLDGLARGTAPKERARLVLWGLDNLKSSQERQKDDGPWEWRPLEAHRLPEGERALAALRAALEAWDPPAADAALVGAVRSVPAAELDLLLAEYGMRCRGNIGHKAIYAAQSRRALPLAGPTAREGVLRSLVASCFIGGKNAEAEVFETSRDLARKAPEPKEKKPREDPGPARELLEEMRTSAGKAVPAVVARLLASGAHPDALWDAVFVGASEVTLAHVSIASLHALTSAEALHHVAHDLGDERLARLALLQAAAWVAFFRGTALKEDAQRAYRVEARPAEEQASLALVRAKGNDVHEFKLAAAALDAARAAGSFARPALLTALASHLPPPDRPDGPELLRIDKALADAG